MKEKLSSKETEVSREIKRRQKTHIELMDVRCDFNYFDAISIYLSDVHGICRLYFLAV